MSKTRETLAEVTEKMRKYCVYQERSHQEIRTKLLKQNVFGDDLEQIIAQLVEEDFLNEERFAKAYAKGKFSQNKWGRRKIVMHLKQKGVSDYCIRKGLNEIEDEAYLETMDKLLRRRLTLNVDFSEKKKAADHLIRKGYEPELVRERIEAILDERQR